MNTESAQVWFVGELFSEETGHTTDGRYATDVQEAISAWEQDGYTVISVTDEHGNEYGC